MKFDSKAFVKKFIENKCTGYSKDFSISYYRHKALMTNDTVRILHSEIIVLQDGTTLRRRVQ